MSRKISLYISAMNRPAAEQVLSQLTADFEFTEYEDNGKMAIRAQFDDSMSKALRWAAQFYAGGRDTEPFISSIIRSRRVEMQKAWGADCAHTGVDDTGGGILAKDITKLLYEIRTKAESLQQ